MKSLSILVGAMTLQAVALAAGGIAEQPMCETVCGSLTVTLRDGSQLLGRPLDFDALPTSSDAGKREIPLVQISSFRMNDDRVSAVVNLQRGGHFLAIVGLDAIRLQTSIGELNLPLAEVASCQVNTATVTAGNVALASRGASVSGVFDGGSGPALIDGNTTDYGSIPGSAHGASHGSAHVVGLPPSWVVELPQTYLLREIRVLLWDRDQRFYRYVVETSVDGQIYRTAANRSEGEWRSWQKLAFSPRPVRYIRLRGIYSSRLKGPNGIHVVELEAYCHPPRDGRLVFWNTLGSGEEIQYSKVGPSGKIVGSGVSFVPGKVGKGFTSGHGKAGPNFGPWEQINPSYHRAGTIAFWWQPARDYDEPNAPPDEIFVSGNWQRPWILPFQLLYRWRQSEGNLGGFDFQVADEDRQQHYLCTGKVVPFKAGDWLHVAYVWDVNGLPNDKTRRYGVFVNGEYCKLVDSGNPGGDINYTMGRPEGAYFSMGYYDADYHNQLQGTLDEVKIWDFARTNFRDDMLAINRVAEAEQGRNAAPGELLLWNKLGSKKEVHKSEVGPGGTYSGEGGRFVEGRFGGALSATAEEIHYQQPALVTFPKEVISTDAGCVEVWAKLDDFPNVLRSGENPALFKIHDGTCSYIIHLNGNDGASKGGLCGRAGGNSSTGTSVFGTWTYEQVLGKGQVEQWHHYALVWDKDGIPNVDDGTRKIALFLDGRLNSQKWGTGPRPWVNHLTGGKLRLLLNHHLSQGTVTLDNLKIWNYAKTDFSDRSVEGISRGLDGVLTEPPGEFQVDYAGLPWDLMRTGWRVEDGKLKSQRRARPGFQYGHSANGRGGFVVTGIGDKSWTDYEVAFDFKMLPANREFFHAHIPGDSRGMSVPFRTKLLSESWNQPHTCYSFGLRPTGSWSMGVSEDYYMPGHGWIPPAKRKGKTEKLASGKSEFCQDASQGRLRLRVKGNTITVWLNDEQLVEHTHKGEVVDPIRYGGFGVGWRYESMGWISNLEVKKL